MTVDSLICEKCKHLDMGERSLRWCRAFDELPYDFGLKNKHDEVIKGQTGSYLFEKKIDK